MLEWLTIAADFGMILGIAGVMMIVGSLLHHDIQIQRQLKSGGNVAISMFVFIYATVVSVVYIFLL